MHFFPKSFPRRFCQLACLPLEVRCEGDFFLLRHFSNILLLRPIVCCCVIVGPSLHFLETLDFHQGNYSNSPQGLLFSVLRSEVNCLLPPKTAVQVAWLRLVARSVVVVTWAVVVLGVVIVPLLGRAKGRHKAKTEAGADHCLCFDFLSLRWIFLLIWAVASLVVWGWSCTHWEASVCKLPYIAGMSVSCPARPILRPSPGALRGYVTTITTNINTHPNPRQNLPSIPILYIKFSQLYRVGKISKKSLIFRLSHSWCPFYMSTANTNFHLWYLCQAPVRLLPDVVTSWVCFGDAIDVTLADWWRC